MDSGFSDKGVDQEKTGVSYIIKSTISDEDMKHLSRYGSFPASQPVKFLAFQLYVIFKMCVKLHNVSKTINKFDTNEYKY